MLSESVKCCLIIIIFSDDMDSHITDLGRVLRAAGFTLKGSKSQSSITDLGFRYSAQSVSSSTDKTKVIAEWPTLKELRSFLGLANFYRNFVSGFANISAPLNDLTSNILPHPHNCRHIRGTHIIVHQDHVGRLEWFLLVHKAWPQIPATHTLALH